MGRLRLTMRGTRSVLELDGNWKKVSATVFVFVFVCVSVCVRLGGRRRVRVDQFVTLL